MVPFFYYLKEELEVLKSIYDGDSAFKQISDTVFQYKFGEEGSYKCFLVEISWPPNYPEELPVINMELFYNKHVVPVVKETVKTGLTHQAEELLGMSMTFSLFEWVKDNLETLLADQPNAPAVLTQQAPAVEEESEDAPQKKEKKEQMTKSQKRRMFDRFGATTDRPRGWDWVDIIKHLAQTGNKPDS
ncbi:RWD domain-containing protein 4 [Biomphalaria pfeifferi]|uniref:RWD domain-containing protein 4 n=1 Tax=Biomphalaria pfeifferi TaxID=112525 RepID=A0AAD8BQB0_BIOPF|nr:RWD domain-containing protein 4 [Biomphalaria pfeifferi]